MALNTVNEITIKHLHGFGETAWSAEKDLRSRAMDVASAMETAVTSAIPGNLAIEDEETIMVAGRPVVRLRGSITIRITEDAPVGVAGGMF